MIPPLALRWWWMACFTARACLGQSTSSMGMEALPAGPGSSENAGLRSGSGPILFWGGSSAAAPVGNNRGDASHPCRPGNNAQRRAQRRSLANQIKKSGDQPTAGSDRTTFDHFGTISRSRSSVNRATPPTFQAMFTNRCPPPSRPVRSAINRAARAHWPDRRASNAFASVVARFP